METENQSMISNMIYIRTSLELANESKKKIEAINAILMEKSETDELTGLANRYKLSEYSRTVMDEFIIMYQAVRIRTGISFMLLIICCIGLRKSRETASVWADFMSPMHN